MLPFSLPRFPQLQLYLTALWEFPCTFQILQFYVQREERICKTGAWEERKMHLSNMVKKED